jgi:hypothetical protein
VRRSNVALRSLDAADVEKTRYAFHNVRGEGVGLFPREHIKVSAIADHLEQKHPAVSCAEIDAFFDGSTTLTRRSSCVG